ncbi:DUF3775 domain-containing protein [Dongia deserti]|uniref:DUF3775 domain-containing protein n=1 Tax=Dongia deserti TaxID=2268030 RepID=UPI000E6483FA|nr:DUF3775 domain-containing protein [Dongia deserti]
MPSLSIPIETLGYIIERAREFDAEVPPVLTDDGSNPIDDEAGDTTILEDRLDNPTAEELAAALDQLNEDQRDEIIALTWVGRGDFSKDDWREAVEAAHDRHNGDETRYLLGTPLLSDLLEEGAAQLGYSREDLEEGEP